MIKNKEKTLLSLLKKILKSKTKKIRDYRYGDGYAAERIVKILKNINFKYEKKLKY